MLRVVAVLETMWDWRSQTSEAGYNQAPRYFRINPQNFSGRRLYKLIGSESKLLVTNACRELVTGPEHHGKPDPQWLAENLSILDGQLERLPQHVRENEVSPLIREGLKFPAIQVLLVCGRIAQWTYRNCGFEPQEARVVEIPHPAARTVWTRDYIDKTIKSIQPEWADY